MALALEIPPQLQRQIRTARQVGAQRRRNREEEQLPTACDAFDRLLEGGLRRGTMVELIGQRSSGRFSLVLSALAAATGRGEAAALIDLGDSFDPQAAADATVDLERLLWARPRRLKEVLASAEIILSSGIPLVIIDLGMPPIAGGRGHEASWLRLARRALTHRAALLIASPYRVSGTAAQAVIAAKAKRQRWLGGGASPQLLAGFSADLELLKSRHQRPGAPRQGDHQELTWRSAELLDPTLLSPEQPAPERLAPATQSVGPTSRRHLHGIPSTESTQTTFNAPPPSRRSTPSVDEGSRRAIA